MFKPLLRLALLCLFVCPLGFAQVAVTPYITSQPQFLDNNGHPLAAGCVFSYAAGTTTPQATYTDSTGVTPNANPIILNAGGFAPSAVWISNLSYKFTVKSFGGTACATGSQIRTEDNVKTGGAGTVNGATIFNGIATFNAGIISTGSNTTKTMNGCQYVDGTLYTTIQSAVTAASTNGCVIVRSDYTGNDNFTNPNGIVVYDLRGVASKNKTVSVKDFGAKGDLQQEGGDNENTGHGVITSGSATLTDNSATFASTDCQSGAGCTGPSNKLIVVFGAGVAWPARAALTLVSTGALVYQKITINGIPNVAVAFYARIGGTTGAGAVSWPTQWAGPPGLVLHSAGEVVDGTVTWDMIGSAPVAFTQAFTTAMPLVTTITGFTTSHLVTLAATAGTTMTTAKVQWATDDTAAINSAISRACSLVTGGGLSTYGNYVVAFPRGGYGTSSAIVAPNCTPQSGMTLVGDGNDAGGSQQTGAYLWNTNVNTDGIQYTQSPISFLDYGVGVFGLGGGYGTGNGIVIGSSTSAEFEGGVYNAWVANNPQINIREENTNRFIVANNNLGGAETAVFLNGGQAANPSPCGQTNQAQIGPNNKFFAAGGPDILMLNVHWDKISGNAYGPAQGNRLADSTIGAVQVEADASGGSGIGSCTYGNNIEGTYFNNGNDVYVTGPAGFHPSNNQFYGVSTNATQSVVKIANGDNNSIGLFTVFQSAGCFINATNCTNVGAPVVDILGTSAGNVVGEISDSYIVNPPYNPTCAIHVGSTTTLTTIRAASGKGSTASVCVDSGATLGNTDLGLTTINTDVPKATSTTETALQIKSSDTSNPLQMNFQLVGNATAGNRAFYFQFSEPGFNRPIILNPNGGNVGIGSGGIPAFTLDVAGTFRATSTVQWNGGVALTSSSNLPVFEVGTGTVDKLYTSTQPLTGGAATHTLGNSFAFTSSATFGCTCTDQTAAAACRANPASATTVTLAGTGSDVLWLSCSGH